MRMLVLMSSLLLSFFGVIAFAVAEDISPASKLPIRDVKSLPPGKIDWSYDSERLTELSDSTRQPEIGKVSRELASQLLSDVLVDTLYLNRALLDLPSEKLALAGASFGVPRQLAHLTVEIENQKFVLFVGDVVYDKPKKLRHVTAAILNMPDAHARFTIDDARDLIVGTISTSTRSYRILPNPSGGQLVFRFTSSDANARYNNVTKHRPIGEEVSSIENRHRLVELLGDIHPWHVNFSSNEFMWTIVGGEIGSLDLDSLDPRQIQQLLVRLDPITRATGDEQFKIVHITPPSPDGEGLRAVRFQQIVNGYAVDFDQEIVIDGATGRIQRLQIGLVDGSNVVRASSFLSKEQAHSYAVQAVRKAVGNALAQVKDTAADPELMYRLTGQEQLTLVWRFVLGFGRTEYHAEVNASTGESAVWSADKAFEHDIYATTSGSPDQGSDPGTSMIIHEDEGFDECYAANPSDCSLPKYYMPGRIIGILESLWVQSRGTDVSLCCAGIGTPPEQVYPTWTDKVLDVIVDTPEATATGPLYRATTQSVLFAPGPPHYSRSLDVVAHEVMHGYIHRYNRSFNNDPRSSASSLVEGMCDAMAALMSEMQQNNANFTNPDPTDPNDNAIGQPWILGDSPAAPFSVLSQRKLAVSVNWALFQNGSLDPHDRGVAIGNFYYRLFSHHAVSNLRLMEFMLQVASRIRDPNADGHDLNDFYNALIDSVEPGETALLNAINDVWDLMTPPGGGGGVPPTAPPFIAGVPAGCVNGYSVFGVSWPASSGADGYHGYGSIPGGYEYMGSSAAPASTVWTNYSWDFRVAAFNQYGISGLSPTGFSVVHSQCM